MLALAVGRPSEGPEDVGDESRDVVSASVQRDDLDLDAALAVAWVGPGFDRR